VAVIEPEVVEEPERVPEPELAEASETTSRFAPEPEPYRPGGRAARERLLEPERVTGDTPLSAIERLALGAEMSPQMRRRDRVLTAAWAASFAALTGLGVAGYTERNTLMQQWPASKRVYATLGLTPINGKSTTPKDGAVEPSKPEH
jgi:hypothetical protein